MRRSVQVRLEMHAFLVHAALDAAILDLPPTANDDAAATFDDGSRVTIHVLANDTPGTEAIDPTTVEVVGQPANGIVSVDPTTGAITYVDADWTGLDKMRQWAHKLDNQPAAGNAD